MKILHVIGGDLRYGASKGALILHDALLKAGINSSILNDTPSKSNSYTNTIYINNNFISKFIGKIYVSLEKILKTRQSLLDAIERRGQRQKIQGDKGLSFLENKKEQLEETK